ncbi:MAG: radical SAM protein [Clostridia bacterium]|nr:radical SAM protein [Clostridia bacterium]
MLVSRMMHPVCTLGPGERFAIWVSGCKRRCKKCANPELQAFDPKNEIPIDVLIQVVSDFCISKGVTGITISGGEPFEQPEELEKLVYGLPEQVHDILVFSGYTIEQLHEKKNPAIEKVLARISVLVDGEYKDELNQGHPLKGSQNQRIWFLQDEVKEAYEQFIRSHEATVQQFATSDDVFAIGIHRRNFDEDLARLMKKKGLSV